ncbi:uncharacterized protein LOC128338998 isoform X2 [Hemicordylus capensis]|uniref:uncharacterized protein LOC128338998 isoform X2 n=1 Tax=Hemicordylus capensis TaxID=884348 RepID=UPI002304C651|nr:uncharacterized protein LOC128338998 isoform X2 [Hemicordylus capensis]
MATRGEKRAQYEAVLVGLPSSSRCCALNGCNHKKDSPVYFRLRHYPASEDMAVVSQASQSGDSRSRLKSVHPRKRGHCFCRLHPGPAEGEGGVLPHSELDQCYGPHRCKMYSHSQEEGHGAESHILMQQGNNVWDYSGITEDLPMRIQRWREFRPDGAVS